MNRIIFRLKNRWINPDGTCTYLYRDILEGRKTSEFRDCIPYWENRLYKKKMTVDTLHLAPKVDRAWFIVGFPKGNVPRIEADITNILIHNDADGFASQYEIRFTNVEEVTE